MSLIDDTLFLVGIFTAGLTLFVYLRDRRNPINRSFAFFLLTIVVWPFAIASFRTATTISLALFWDKVIYILGSLTPMAWLIFAYIFPHKVSVPKWVIFLSTILAISFFVSIFSTHLWIQSINLSRPEKAVQLGPMYLSWVFYWFVYMTWGTILLIRKYLVSTGFVRAQLQFVLLATLVPATGAMLPNVILPLFGIYQFIHLGPLFLAATNVIIAYAILKHRLLDIHMMVAKSVAYTLVISCLLGLYLVSAFVVNLVLLRSTLSSVDFLSSFLFALVTALGFQPLLRFFENMTNSIFHRDHYETQEVLYRLTQVLASKLELIDLLQGVFVVLLERVGIAGMAVDLVDDRGTVYAREISPRDSGNYQYTEAEFGLLKRPQRMIIFDEEPEGDLKDILRRWEIFVFAPIFDREIPVGYLILGPKTSGEIYYEQDIQLLKFLNPEFSLAIRNAQQYEEIKHFNTTLKSEVAAATANLVAANRKLEDLDRLKNEFISIASHDLRTPAASVKNHLWMVLRQKRKLPATLEKDLLSAYNANERTVALVSDILDVSRIEGGGLQVRREKVDLDRILHEVEDAITPKGKSKGVAVSFV